MLRPLPFPRRISVEVTNHCNQRCRLCPRLEFTRPLGFMDPALFERIARECAPHGTALWLHFLGEPLLHRDVVDMIRTAKALGVRQVGLSTNAVALGTYTEPLLASGLDRLECSIDAIDRDGYVDMRGRDHFERAVGNVRGFLQRKRQLGLDIPLTSIQFMRTPEVEAMLDTVVAAWRPYLGARDFVMTIVPNPFGGAIAADLPSQGERRPCQWLFESLVICQDGTVTMCGADWDARAPLGRLQQQTLAEIWNSAEMRRRRDAHLAGEFGAIEPCAKCEDWRLADGSAYSNALLEIEAATPKRATGS